MIISRAPLRISFAGGGSDFPAYFMKSEEPGLVVSAAIQKYVYVVLNKKFDDDICIKYSKTENVRHVSEIQHDIVREALKYFEISNGIEIATLADVPGQGTGLGSSSALTVALVKALAKYTNAYYTPYECARVACEIETKKCGHPIGYQDQFASSFGGLNTIEFRKRETRVDAITPMSGVGLLEDNLILFWIGIRNGCANEILKEHNEKLSGLEFIEKVKETCDLARTISTNLWADDIDSLGNLLNKGWEMKKALSNKVTTEEIDSLYSRAIENGATGGKVLGAGGGGFMLIFAAPHRHCAIKSALGLKSMPVKIDLVGAKIIEQK